MPTIIGDEKEKIMEKKKVGAIALTAVMSCGVLASCGPQKVQDNPFKTYIEVQTYEGGYGYTWIEEVADRFEEIYKDYKIGDKTGVEIRIHAEKDEAIVVYEKKSTMTNDIYFLEGMRNLPQYHQDKSLIDLTDIATEVIPEQGHSIVDVMKDELKDSMANHEEDGKHYYALPLATGFAGLVYDAEFFYNRGLYLTKEYDTNGNEGVVNDYVITKVSNKNTQGEYATLVNENGVSYFKTNKGELLSRGPDGTYGTYDDGLPSTYKEFFNLCKYMKEEENIYPFIYAGKYSSGYIKWLLSALEADYDGYEQGVIKNSLDGTLTNLISVDDDGNITKLPNVQVDPNNESGNNKNVFKSAGKYYAMNFVEQMYVDDGEYLHPDCFNSADHLTAQESFMLSPRDKNKAAFLIEGLWWEYEATDTFNDLSETYGDSYSKANRQFRQLPLPKATMEQVEKKQGSVARDDRFMTAFMLKNVVAEEKIEICKKFIQFCLTDENNQKYTQLTGIPRPYDYELSGAQYNGLTSYSRSLWDMYACANNVVFGYSQSKYHQQYSNFFSPLYYGCHIKGVTYLNPVEVLSTKKLGAKAAFDGLYTDAVINNL